MENIIKVGFNLIKILSLVKSNIKGSTEIELHLNNDNTLLIRNGGLAYYFNQEILQKVLNDNDFQTYFEDESQDLVSELISKHIINELYESMGKAFPKIN